MNKLFFNDKGYELPSCYNELTPKQLRQIIKLLFLSITPAEARLRLLMILLKHRLVCYWFIFHRIDIDDFAWKLKILTDFVWSENRNFTKNPFPKIRVYRFWHFKKVRFLYGPLDRLKNISFEEFCEADTMFMRYCQTQNPSYLHRLIAILYRFEVENFNPKSADFQGERREKFNSFTVDSRISLISKIPVYKQFAIFLFYEGSRNYLIKEFDTLFISDNRGGQNQKVWAKILRKVAGNLSNTDKIATMQVRAVFFELQESLYELEKQNQSIKK